jgi:hypothetical protein
MISADPADPTGLAQSRTHFGPQMRCGEHDSPVRKPGPELLEGVCGSQVQIDVGLRVEDEKAARIGRSKAIVSAIAAAMTSE